MNVPDDSWIDFVHLARDVHTGEPISIVVLDTFDVEAQELDAQGARAVARRLNALADEMERPRTIRRLSIVDEQFREREGGV